VEGFRHWAADELGRLSSVQRATKEEGAPQFWAHLFLVPAARLVQELAMCTGSIVFDYLLYLLL
jgi:hypothetical protein